jgi:hypothetical protein
MKIIEIVEKRRNWDNNEIDLINYKFNDCLPGKEWLEAHHKDEYPEATIELIVDGKEPITFNGDYRKGCIKEYLALNKK